ncbi:MAG: twin-arginine translocase subunit TatC [Alphaproteobacteria bacterium]|nr:twin-arginine translocase subunit TatC [Alphaproteobacteria bacterium]
MSKPADDEAHIEASRAPLLDHLIELRKRLMWSLVGFVVAFVGCYFFAEQIYAFLTHPLAVALEGQPGRRMIYTALYETFFTYIKVAGFGALCISFPIIASQIWMFVAPGLYRDERRAFLPFLFATPILFIMGAALVYWGLMPVMIHFFLGFETPGGAGSLPIQLEAKVSDYLDLVMSFIFAFGLSFQLPVLLTLLGRVGLVSSDFLKRNRRYAIVFAFVVAAVLTPPDIISQFALAIPLIILFEASIWSVQLIEKQRADEAKRAESAV